MPELPDAAARPPLTHDELVALAAAHSLAEGSNDIEGTMATLDEHDVAYELQPMGRVLVGRADARAYYEHFFASFLPRVVGTELRNQWINERSVAREHTLWVRGDDGEVEQHGVLGIMLFGTHALTGERVWGSERLLRLMFGPLYDRTVPLSDAAAPPR